MWPFKNSLEKVSCEVFDHDWDKDKGSPYVWEVKCKRCGKEQTRWQQNISTYSHIQWRDKK